MKKLFKTTCLIVPLLTSCSINGPVHDEQDYIVELSYKENFKILQLTDIHMSVSDDLNEDFSFLSLTIKEANPDLMILTGDIFFLANKYVVNQTFNFIDSFNIPWAYTYGNHDEQGYYSSNYISDYLQSDNLKNCLYKNFKDDIEGEANYVIDLVENGSTKYQFYIFDSNTYNFVEGSKYDYIHYDQIAWYERMVKYSTKKRFNEDFSNTEKRIYSQCFFHIPLVEYIDALAEHMNEEYTLLHARESNSDDPKDYCCPSKINTHLFDKIKDLGSSYGVYCGHDHTNNFTFIYQGITLSYGTKSTDNIYHLDDMMGGSLITIENEFTKNPIVTPIYHTYEEI